MPTQEQGNIVDPISWLIIQLNLDGFFLSFGGALGWMKYKLGLNGWQVENVKITVLTFLYSSLRPRTAYNILHGILMTVNYSFYIFCRVNYTEPLFESSLQDTKQQLVTKLQCRVVWNTLSIRVWVYAKFIGMVLSIKSFIAK